MRILFSSVGGYGHLIPLLPLATAAREAGDDVLVATAEPFHGLIADIGLRPVSAGGSIRDAARELARNPPGDPRQGGTVIFGDILPRRVVPDLDGIIEGFKPDLVVYEALNPGAAIAAGNAGVRAVCHGLGRFSGSSLWSAMASAWTATARTFGLETAGDQLFGNAYIDICPPSLQSPAGPPANSVLRLRPVTLDQPTALPKVVLDRAGRGIRPLIYLTLGTAFGSDDALKTAMTALSSLKADVLVATGLPPMPADGWQVPANVFVETWVSQGTVLRHVDLVVSHGGSGTMLGALSEGLPQLLLPQGADQFHNAQAIAEAGLGQQLAQEARTAESIAQAADELLHDDAVLERTRETAREISLMPSCAQILEQLR